MRLLTVGHGTQPADDLARLVAAVGVALVVDVRRFPGSRRSPQFARDELARWLPESGVDYRWDERLGGRRPATTDSRNVGLRNASFRAYADYMDSAPFSAGLAQLVDDLAERTSAVMCAESLWWRCHRRLIADAATLLCGVGVEHVMPGGVRVPHRTTPGVRVIGDTLVYEECPPGQGSLL